MKLWYNASEILLIEPSLGTEEEYTVFEFKEPEAKLAHLNAAKRAALEAGAQNDISYLTEHILRALGVPLDDIPLAVASYLIGEYSRRYFLPSVRK